MAVVIIFGMWFFVQNIFGMQMEEISFGDAPREDNETLEIEFHIQIGGSDTTVREEEKTDTISKGKEEPSPILENSTFPMWLTELEVGKITDKKYLSYGEKIRLSLLGEEGVGILAVRVNGEGCRWHWESGNIVPEYEKGGEVLTEIVFVHEIKK